MKAAVAILFLASLHGIVMGTEQAEAGLIAKPAIPARSEIADLLVRCEGGWRLIIRPDGSGRLTCGSLPIDSAQIGAGKLNFNGIFDAVTRIASREPGPSDECSIVFSRATDSVGYPFYLNDSAVVAQLFASSLMHGDPNQPERFSETLKKFPLPTRLSTGQTASPIFSADFTGAAERNGNNGSASPTSQGDSSGRRNTFDTEQSSSSEKTNAILANSTPFWRSPRLAILLPVAGCVLIALIVRALFQKRAGKRTDDVGNK